MRRVYRCARPIPPDSHTSRVIKDALPNAAWHFLTQNFYQISPFPVPCISSIAHTDSLPQFTDQPLPCAILKREPLSGRTDDDVHDAL